MTKKANVYTTAKPNANLLMTAVLASQATRDGTDFETVAQDQGVTDARKIDNDAIEFGVNPNGLSEDMTLSVTPAGGKPFSVELSPGARVDQQISNAMSRAAAAGHELLKGLQF